MSLIICWLFFAFFHPFHACISNNILSVFFWGGDFANKPVQFSFLHLNIQDLKSIYFSS